MHPDGYDGSGFLQKLMNLYDLQAQIDNFVIANAKPNKPFIVTEQLICDLHSVAMGGLLEDAGQYRKGPVHIKNSPHIPPSEIEVPAHMLGFCQYLNNNWEQKDLIHLSAFAMWRLNWIHPFTNGNGRVTRGVSYLILCMKHGELLPAKSSVAQQIAENKQPYYQALIDADAIFAQTQNIDMALVSMIDLLSYLLTEQLKANI